MIRTAGVGAVEDAIFATTDTSTIAAVLSSLVEATTGQQVHSGRWYRSSVTAVASVRLDSGRTVVVRAYQPGTSATFIDGVVRVQAHLAAAGFPCPIPSGAAIVVDGVLGRTESLVPDPGPRRFAPSEMTGSAASLARLVALAGGLDPAGLEHHPMSLTDTALYPPPHSPVFDFAATTSGAEWIDEIAVAARAAMTDTSAVIAHGDWSARNVRLGASGLVCAFDWESLQYGPESTALGIAAATWRALGEPDEPMAPAAAEIRQYVEQYERARRRPLTAGQRRSAGAAAVYALAYTARCEHALEHGTREGRASARLARDAGLLDLLR